MAPLTMTAQFIAPGSEFIHRHNPRIRVKVVKGVQIRFANSSKIDAIEYERIDQQETVTVRPKAEFHRYFQRVQ